MSTKFNPENKSSPTYGECLGPAMKITDQADADQYKLEYIAHIQGFLDTEPNENGMTAEQIANTNLGYYAGYYDTTTRERVERLFRCAHPVFGAVKDGGGNPSPEAAFALGKTLAKS